MPKVSRPEEDPWKDRVAKLEDRFAELERRVNPHGTMRDAQGNIIAATDPLTGTHLGRPYVPTHFAPIRAGDQPRVFVDSFEWIYRAVFYKQHPSLLVGFFYGANSGTSGRVELRIGSLVLGAATIADGAAGRMVIGPVRIPGGHLSVVEVDVYARRTAGTGEFFLQWADAVGVQS